MAAQEDAEIAAMKARQALTEEIGQVKLANIDVLVSEELGFTLHRRISPLLISILRSSAYWNEELEKKHQCTSICLITFLLTEAYDCR